MVPKNNYIFCLILVSLLIVVVSPLVLVFPGKSLDNYSAVILSVCITLGFIATHFAGNEIKKTLFQICMMAAGATIGSMAIIKLWPYHGTFDYFTLGILAPLFHLDGEDAYDATLFEIFCEIWFALIFAMLLIIKIFRLRKA